MSEERGTALDDADRRIIHRLAEGVEPELDSVANDAGVPLGEARQRFERLRTSGVVRECAVRIEPSAVGLPVTGFLLVRVAQNSENYEAICQMVRDLEEVEEAHAVSGDFDWLLKVRCWSLNDLQRLVIDRLSLLPGYIRSQTCIVLDTACDYANADVVTSAGY
ncbi:MAG: Lrp/AsnC family transcriptional regulator [Acidimicrobiales bacterium]